MSRPLIIGLTGSIGMGKSTVAAMFAGKGVPVFDADAQVRAMQGPGGALVPAIELAFPGSTDSQGVCREKLGGLVFGDAAALARLEGIVHPAVASARRAFLKHHAAAPMVVFDIPLLFEKTGKQGLDHIVVVSAPAEVQRARVLARAGMTEEKFLQILGLQLPDAQKRARADTVIETGTSLEETELAVNRLIKTLYSGCKPPAAGE